MQLSLATIIIALAGLAAAAPAAASKHKTVGEASQTCTASQSSIHCCHVNGNKNNSGGPKKGESVLDGKDVAICSTIITDGNENKAVSEICSATVACCIGDGCVAIAY